MTWDLKKKAVQIDDNTSVYNEKDIIELEKRILCSLDNLIDDTDEGILMKNDIISMIESLFGFNDPGWDSCGDSDESPLDNPMSDMFEKLLNEHGIELITCKNTQEDK